MLRALYDTVGSAHEAGQSYGAYLYSQPGSFFSVSSLIFNLYFFFLPSWNHSLLGSSKPSLDFKACNNQLLLNMDFTLTFQDSNESCQINSNTHTHAHKSRALSLFAVRACTCVLNVPFNVAVASLLHSEWQFSKCGDNEWASGSLCWLAAGG